MPDAGKVKDWRHEQFRAKGGTAVNRNMSLFPFQNPFSLTFVIAADVSTAFFEAMPHPGPQASALMVLLPLKTMQR